VCLFLVLLAFSPRIAAAFWWIIQPTRWDSAFSSWLWPILGIIFLPWTTIMWVAVAPFGNLGGTDWIWIVFGIFLDLLSFASSGYRGRQQYYGSSSY
jgi:hypothetical protein